MKEPSKSGKLLRFYKPQETTARNRSHNVHFMYMWHLQKAKISPKLFVNLEADIAWYPNMFCSMSTTYNQTLWWVDKKVPVYCRPWNNPQHVTWCPVLLLWCPLKSSTTNLNFPHRSAHCKRTVAVPLNQERNSKLVYNCTYPNICVLEPHFPSNASDCDFFSPCLPFDVVGASHSMISQILYRYFFRFVVHRASIALWLSSTRSILSLIRWWCCVITLRWPAAATAAVAAAAARSDALQL